MEELVYLKKDEAVCDSLVVAEKFEKQHKSVLRAIEKIIKDSPAQNCARCFKKTTYKDEQGKPRPMYLMNRDGFTFLAMGFTGKKANEWKWQYIKAFNSMETFLQEKKSSAGIEARENSKVSRRAETDIIKEFVQYAKNQGSQNADKYYMNYTRMVNNALGIKDRELATIRELNCLTLTEGILEHCIREGMEESRPYKEIFGSCKERLEAFANIAYLKAVSG